MRESIMSSSKSSMGSIGTDQPDKGNLYGTRALTPLDNAKKKLKPGTLIPWKVEEL